LLFLVVVVAAAAAAAADVKPYKPWMNKYSLFFF
jgi:hypothetical protein